MRAAAVLFCMKLECPFWYCCAAVVLWAGSAAATDFPVLQQQIDDIRQRHGVSAAAVILVEDKTTRLAHYSGVTDWAQRRPVSEDTYFRVGSVTKAFTGLALLRAEQQGVLRLDQPLRELLPDLPFENPYAGTDPVRVGHLLEHSAGWYDMSKPEFDHNDPVGLKDALAIAPQSRISHWPPGWHSSYSNIGPGVASYALERQTGQPFGAYMDRHVFEPLGMASATLLPTDSVKARLAAGYDRDGRTPIPYWHIVYPASGAMNVRPKDMARFLQMLVNRGALDGRAVFSSAQIRRLENPRHTLAARTGLEFGYGLGNYHALYRGHVLHGHGGDADGYLAHYEYSLASKRGYFAVINAFNHQPLREIRRVLRDWLVDGLEKPAPPPAIRLPEGRLANLAGNYRRASKRFPYPGWEQEGLEVRADGFRLLTRQSGGRWLPLLPVTERQFRRPDDPVATAAFVKLADGRVVLQGRMGNFIRSAALEFSP